MSIKLVAIVIAGDKAIAISSRCKGEQATKTNGLNFLISQLDLGINELNRFGLLIWHHRLDRQAYTLLSGNLIVHYQRKQIIDTRRDAQPISVIRFRSLSGW